MPRCIHTTYWWCLFLLVLSLQTLLGVMEHSKFEELELGATIPGLRLMSLSRFTCPSTGPVRYGTNITLDHFKDTEVRQSFLSLYELSRNNPPMSMGQ
jgi:hypothetical protein